MKQGELTQAREAYLRALMGFEIILGPSSDNCQMIKADLESLNLPPGKPRCVANLLTQVLTTRAGTNNSGDPSVGVEGPVEAEAPKTLHVEIMKKPKPSASKLIQKLLR